MYRLRIITTLGALPALLLAFGMNAPQARAAATVDITYDISDTELAWTNNFFVVSNNDPGSDRGIVSGTMKVRYASNSSSGMPIVHGSATLLTFNLTVQNLGLDYFPSYSIAVLSGTLHWQLQSPAYGTLGSTGGLVVPNANMLMTGNATCNYPGTVFCPFYFGLPTVPVHPNYQRSGAITAGGSAGPYGGAQSTRHTLSGNASAVGWHPAGALVGLDGDVHVVGREILREAEGHDPKVIPEPGTLLLLGAGTTGLALVGGATRRSLQR